MAYNPPNIANAFAQGAQLGQSKQKLQMEKDQIAAGEAEKVAATESKNAVRNAEAAFNLDPNDENFQQLNQLDPGKASNLKRMIDEGKQKEAAAALEKTGSEFYGIMNSEDPAGAYQQFWSSLPPEVQKTMPDAYDEGYARLQMASSAHGLKMLESLDTGKQKNAESNALIEQRKASAQKSRAEATKISKGSGSAYEKLPESVKTKVNNANKDIRAYTDQINATFDPAEKKRLEDLSVKARAERDALLNGKQTTNPGSPIDLSAFIKK